MKDKRSSTVTEYLQVAGILLLATFVVMMTLLQPTDDWYLVNDDAIGDSRDGQ